MKKITLIALMLFTALGYAQVGINTNNPDASSALEIESTTGGILIPRLTETQRDAISAPATGLMIYQTNGTSGFYFYDGNIWTKVDGVAGPQGVAGAAGPTGPQGVDGLPGVDGTNGTDGVDGLPGTDGTNGTDGVDGADGTDGVDGAPGLPGADGTDGADGLPGTDGTNGTDGVDGLPGADGTDGVDGAPGLPGADGTDGVDGAPGPTGATGPSGLTGAAGVDGIDGAQGSIGLTGAAGVDGVDGAQGPIGLTGAAGINGEDGTNGVDGADGNDGATGATGADGASYTQPTYLNNTFYAELGGYVIQISPNGKHGLVVAMQDQGFSNWYEASDILSNALNHDADGKEFSDWRLPTKRELNLMYVVFISGNAANFDSYYYWSSTENDYNRAWTQYFGNGNQGNGFKDYTTNVRAVRAF